jgi:hypothetical protein
MIKMTAIKKLGLAVALSVLPTSAVFAQLFSQANGESTLISPQTQIDYNSLRQLLAAKQWRKANDRTERLMLRAANRQAQGWVSSQDIAKFPCWDLQTIDRLWKESSDGRFGFSVQYPIFLETGNRPGRLVDVDAYEKFGDRVGWREQQEWVSFKENLTYNLDAPVGHLPNPRQEYQINGGRLEYVTLTKRMVECKLVANPTNAAPNPGITNPTNRNAPADPQPRSTDKQK